MHRSLKDRRRFLKENMTEVGNRIKLSEIKHITKKPDLVDMIKDVFKKGLEGLMIKDIKSTYEPGKRHWLKVLFQFSTVWHDVPFFYSYLVYQLFNIFL